jgi:Asp-tRNA(Asn)/Glu-tRNA(Gln) amidotransferase A subunit family amidase
LPTALGLSATEFPSSTAKRSATAVQRLEAQGAIALGKTVTSALAFDRPGPTRNPRDLSRSPGASSSGSAAAVAAGMVPLALGSQAVGSIVRPASYCGVWAYVPSHGALPADGSLVLSETLDRIGIFASSAEGLALAGRHLIGVEDSEAGRRVPNRGPRVGVIANGSLASRAPEPSRLLDVLLAEHPDLLLPLPTDIDFSAVLDATRTIAAFEFHLNLEKGRHPLASLDRALVASHAPARPAEQAYRTALAFRGRLANAWGRLTAECDAVLLPSSVADAPVGLLDDQDPAPAALGSLLGLPAVNIPLFTSAGGLPLGCQLLGKQGADMDTLQLAIRLAGDSASDRSHRES